MRTLIAFLISIVFVGAVFCQQIPPRIENTFVQDHAQILSPEDEALIQTQLNEFKTKYETEVGVATVQTMNGADDFDYSLKMAREYGVGSKDNEKRGILLFLAIKDRQCYFQVSRHMEAYLIDSQAASLCRNVLAPKLKIASKSNASADWKDAVMAGLLALDKNFQPKVEPQQITPTEPVDYTNGLLILGGIGSVLGLGIGGAVIRSRAKRRREEAEYAQIVKEEAEMRRKESEAHELWLKTPEGIAYTEKQEAERLRLAEERRRREEEHARWLASPEGIAHTKRLREEEAERERKRKEKKRKEKKRSTSTTTDYSSSNSSYSSSNSSSSYSSGSSFGGGGDFGGGGGGSSW